MEKKSEATSGPQAFCQWAFLFNDLWCTEREE